MSFERKIGPSGPLAELEVSRVATPPKDGFVMRRPMDALSVIDGSQKGRTLLKGRMGRTAAASRVVVPRLFGG